MTEVKPDQQVKDGQEVESDAVATLEQQAQENIAEISEQATDASATLEPQSEKVETATLVTESAASSTVELLELETRGDEHAGENGVFALHEEDAEHTAPFDSPSENVSDEQDAEKPKGFFRRRVQNLELKKLKTENEKLADEVEVFRDRYVRLAAEMENFRKRTDRDFYSRVQNEVARTVLGFLPLVDDLERCLNVKEEFRDYDALDNGVRLIHQKFGKILSDYGVMPMNAVGKEFNPNFHEALTEMASADQPAGMVLEEHSKGYMLRDKVLRPAKVIVSK